MNPIRSFALLISTLIFPLAISAQLQTVIVDDEKDKCGTSVQQSVELLSVLGDKWGYGYEDLLADLNSWGASEYVRTDYIGESTMGREIWELTITDESYTEADKRRIYIHARTHPGEVQAFWVTDEMINILMGDSELGLLLRSTCIFHIVPMYNPDGVELEKPRQNANDIDIESNWDSPSHEIEVQHLKARFEELMGKSNPVEVALNMHSDNDCKRFFVYHHQNGTSRDYAYLEKKYIGAVTDHFPTDLDPGFEPYSYMVTWTSSAPRHYPESWWWYNHGEDVLALTYEDMNCETAGHYDKTALAMLQGLSDYLELESTSYQGREAGQGSRAYPNPFTDLLTVEWDDSRELRSLQVTDLLGRSMYRTDDTGGLFGKLEIPSSDWEQSSNGSAFYFVSLIFRDGTETLKVLRK